MAQIHCCQICGTRLNDSCTFASLSYPPSSVIEHLLGSNVPPTLLEKNSIKQYLLRVQEKLNIFDEAIENLRKARAELESERVEYASLISPIRALPPEILSEIFLAYNEGWWQRAEPSKSGSELEGWYLTECALSTQPLETLSDWSLTQTMPMRVVSQVCHSWRAVARSCSALWSNIYLGGVCTDDDLHAAQKLLTDQLEFSSSRPLRIHASICGNILGPDEYPSFLSQYIFPTHRRWMNVKMPVEDNILRALPKPSIAPIFPMLVSLFIEFHYPYDGSAYRLSAVDAPLLTEVSLNWPKRLARSEEFQLPWAQLRKLKLTGCGKDVALSIVQGLQKVEELALVSLQDWGVTPTAQQGGTTLSSLRQLEISDVGGEFSSASPLPHLRLPALKTLIWTQMEEETVTYLNTMLRETWPDGQYNLAELFLYSPYHVDEREDDNEVTSTLAQQFESICSHIEVIEIGYPSLCVDLTHIMKLLLRFLKADLVPKLRVFKLQGALFEFWEVGELFPYLRERDIEIRLVNCAFDDILLYEPDSIPRFASDLQRLSNSTVKLKGRLELDIMGPHSKRLTYSPQFGVRVEEMGHHTYEVT